MASLSDMRVMVVDDTEANIDILLETLGDDYKVVVATDGELADTLSVSVRINPQNDAPVITSLDAVEATGYEYFRYLATATDVDGPGLAFSFEGLPAWMDAASDSVYGVPDSDATDTFFTVVASDGSLADTLVVTLRVTQLLDAPALHLSGPNPFKGQTTIQYELPAETDVRLTIYDVRGREVVTLVDGKCPAGYHELMWDATNAQGRRVATGVYFARITTADYGKSVKMMVLR